MSLIGPLISPWPVEQSVLALYRTWLPTYLAEVERQEGLARRALGRPENYIGGEDFNSWLDPPYVIVIVEPVGAPERSASVYVQCFEVQVGCVVIGVETEEEGRQQASLYGAASQLLAKQNPEGLELSGVPLMVGSPDVKWVDPEARREALVVTTFHLYVTTLQVGGPAGKTPAEVPEYQGQEEPFQREPTVESGEVTVQGTPL